MAARLRVVQVPAVPGLRSVEAPVARHLDRRASLGGIFQTATYPLDPSRSRSTAVSGQIAGELVGRARASPAAESLLGVDHVEVAVSRLEESKTSLRPSGDQRGIRHTPSKLVSWTGFEPSLSQIQTSLIPLRKDAKAILRPSGE